MDSFEIKIKHCIICGKKLSKNRKKYCNRKCMSIGQTGEGNPMYGRCKELSPRFNINREDHPMYGKHHSIETIKKMSNSQKGKGLGKTLSTETKEKISKSNKKYYSNHRHPNLDRVGEKNPMFGKPGTMLGKKLSEETKIKISKKSKKLWENKEYREYILKNTLFSYKNKNTKIELKIEEILKEYLIDYEKQKYIDKFIYDFYLKKLNTLIEVNGDYWHANPNKYKKDDVLIYPNGNFKASDIWSRDENKINFAIKNNYKIITIWEYDINKHIDIVKNNLREYI